MASHDSAIGVPPKVQLSTSAQAELRSIHVLRIDNIVKRVIKNFKTIVHFFNISKIPQSVNGHRGNDEDFFIFLHKPLNL